MMYLLDANVFIQAKNFYYGFDICPGFWDWMDAAAAPGREVRSISRVYDELAAGNDTLADWVKPRKGDGRFLTVTDNETQSVFVKVATYVQTAGYTQSAKDLFLGGADPWLVAKAATLGATVVTLEKSEPNAKKRVPLPNICAVFGVPVLDTFALLQAHSAAFGWTE